MQHDLTGAELFRDLKKTAFITLHYLPESRELFLQTEHHHLDGRGLMVSSRSSLFPSLACLESSLSEAMLQAPEI